MGAEFEKDLTKSSTLEYVRAISSTGESILISKADLATVLTELIGNVSPTKNGLATSNMLMTRGYISSGSNLDDFKTTGIYVSTGNPSGTEGCGIGIVMVFKGENSQTVQIYLGQVKSRYRVFIANTSTWSSWKDLSS